MTQVVQDKLEQRLTLSKQAVFVSGFLLFAFSLFELYLVVDSRLAYGRYMSGSLDWDLFAETFDRIETSSEGRNYLRFGFVVALIFWTYFSYQFSVERVGGSRKWNKFWTIGGWLIPIAFFFVPLQVVRETERLSSPDKENSPWSPVWWVSSWAVIVLARVASQDDSDAFSAPLFYNASILSLGAVFVTTAVARFLVRDITEGLIEQATPLDALSSSEDEDSDSVASTEDQSLSMSDHELVADRIRTVAKLHAEGLISAAELEEKKRELFREL